MPKMVIRERALEAIARFIIRYSLVFLAVGAGWLAAATYLCSQFKLYDEPGSWAPPTHPLVKRTKEIEERFGGSNHVVVMVTTREGDIFNHATLEKVKRITAEITGMKGVIPYTVRSIADVNARYMKAEKLETGEDFIENKPLVEQVPAEGDEAGIERIRWGAKHNPLIMGPLVSVAPDGKATVIEADFRTEPFKDTIGNVLPYTDPV